jgi:mannose-1-phosphate guanylyltransferase
MFCFKAGVLLEESFHPEVYENQNWFGKATKWNLDLATSLDIPSISIDYAVMERSKKIKSGFHLNLTGQICSFESVYDYLLALAIQLMKTNMVIGTDNYTAFVGMKDTIFVYTPTANLILKNFHRMSKVCIMHLQETIPIELKTFVVCRLMRGEISKWL